MTFKIKLADTPELLDAAYRLRHQVLVEEEGIHKPTDQGRIVDRFDAYPISAHILVVLKDEQVIGTLRLSLDSSVGLPADEYYDFRQHVAKDSRLIHTGRFCVAKEYQGQNLAMGLILMSMYFGLMHKVTHAIAPIDTSVAPLLKRVGFNAVGEPFTPPFRNTPMVPMILDVDNLNDFFLNFVHRNQLHDFLGDYERWFFDSSEQIIKAGEPGLEAFIIVQGKVEVRLSGTTKVIAELGEGEIFGELGLLTDEPRSADVVAKTDVQVMVLPKTAFLKRLKAQPEKALTLLKTLGKRTQSLIKQLEMTGSK